MCPGTSTLTALSDTDSSNDCSENDSDVSGLLFGAGDPAATTALFGLGGGAGVNDRVESSAWFISLSGNCEEVADETDIFDSPRAETELIILAAPGSVTSLRELCVISWLPMLLTL